MKTGDRNPAPKRNADRVARAYQVLREMAIACEIRPGARVNEVGLAERLGLSRTPVREALNRLVTEGLLEFVPNRGFYRRALDPVETVELYEVRVALERGAFALACARAAAPDIEALAAQWHAVAARAETLSPNALATADEIFHRDLVRLAGNRELARLHERVSVRLRFLRQIDVEIAERRDATFAEHERILESLAAREVLRGGALLERHVSVSRAHVLSVVEQGLARFAAAPKMNDR